ncbi:MAG: M20/M25/M40 family metallo-hydrolase [Planctomycetes bacterium]|nr:M20/M25/M40 family metallo-hydrolase [Planctomycetota bacterium]
MQESAPPARRDTTGRAWLVLAVLVLTYALAAWSAVPPAVLPIEAEARAFSAARALVHLERIEGTGKPHPIGSAENARVRAEIVTTLEALGLAVETDERLAVGGNGAIAVVHNIVARIPRAADASNASKAVLVAAHHDSVPAGPGTSDDGAGVAAILEIARALVAGGPLRNDVILLIDDGEEAGLIGAASFVESHPWRAEVGVVVNLEARGTCGRAHMFETSSDNRSLMHAFARSVPHPSATSVAYELYKRMPNDTDLSVFKEAGYAGLNFAFIGGVARYHTPRDDLAHLDPRSLQHLGESALAVVLELARMDLAHLESGQAVYTDVLGRALIFWPASWSVPLAALALIAVLWSARRALRPRIAWHALALVLGLVACALTAAALTWISTSVHGAMFPWSAQPVWTRLAVLCGSAAASVWVVRALLRRGAGEDSGLHAAHLLFALLGLGVALWIPSACHLFVLPALVAGLAGLVLTQASVWRTLLPLAVAALFFWPLSIGVEEGFGFGAPLGALAGVLYVLAAPAFVAARSAPIMLPACTALIAFVVALSVQPFDEDSPAWLNLIHEHDARAGTARWLALPIRCPLPTELEVGADFVADPKALAGTWWLRAQDTFVAPAERTVAAPPRLDVVAESRTAEGRSVRARLWSPRGAVRFMVRVPEGAELRAVRRGKESVSAGFPRRGIVRCVGIDAPGVELEFLIRDDKPLDIEFLDASADMPPTFEALRALRPVHCVPRGEGDISVILERARL